MQLLHCNNNDRFQIGETSRGGMADSSLGGRAGGVASDGSDGWPQAARRDNAVVRVMLVEDDPSFMRRLRTIVEGDPRLELVSTAASVAEANRVMEGARIDVALVDLGLPDGSGLSVIRRMLERVRGSEVIVLTSFGDEERVIASLEVGATGYLTKDAAPQEIVAGILQVRDGGAPMSPPIARRVLRRFREASSNGPAASGPRPSDGPGLSDREHQVLQFIAKGFTTAEIGGLLALSPNTVLTYVKRVYGKLAVHSRSEAIFEARQHGLL
jgi:DNA-binding NarL/FixJ family response regulator